MSALVTNSTVTRDGIAQLAVELLTRSLVLPRTTMRVAREDYRGTGGTVSVRVRTPRIAREQTTPGDQITFDALEEHVIDVELRHLYDAALLADEENDLSLVDFGRQVLDPQVASVATKAEDIIAAEMNAIEAEYGYSDVFASVLAAREYLTNNNVPQGRRWLAASPSFVTALLSDEEKRLTAVDQSGSSSALRDAVVGRLYGFTVVESNGITAGKAIAYHESAFAVACFAPSKPRGVATSSTHSMDGIALRHINDYVPDRLSDASIVSTYVGAGTIIDDFGGSAGAPLDRAVALEVAPGSE